MGTYLAFIMLYFSPLLLVKTLQVMTPEFIVHRSRLRADLKVPVNEILSREPVFVSPLKLLSHQFTLSPVL